ncbi:MAG: DJ-1/PfpI family protein [Patescibacteria group bacterium]|nr:DJ-1/PfpI family protein [Patescibacteria group bacterium]MCL5093684.1 DJ-1/PfpI family protein [Patescibacteria group bacterium]
METNEIKALMILPHFEFRDEEYEVVRKSLDEAKIKVIVASSSLTEAKGTHNSLVNPDVLLNQVNARDYDAVILVGGPGAKEYYENGTVMQIVRDAFFERILLAAIGRTPSILAYAGIIAGKKITGYPHEQNIIETCGGYYTGRLVEQDGELITGNGPDSSPEFAAAVVKALSWRSQKHSYLR